MRKVLIIAVALLLVFAIPAMAQTASGSQAAGAISEPAPGGFQWSRFSLFGQGGDGYVSTDDPQRLGDLKWSLGNVSSPYSMRLPIEPPIGSLTARFKSGKGGISSTGPMFEGIANGNSSETNGGYMALEWRTGPLALTLGGGYSQDNAFTGEGGSAASGRAFVSTRSGSSSSSGGNARYDALRRWGAYLAVPYQLTERIGLRPEVSYFYEDSLSGTDAQSNEWVMGLQCSFGF